MQRKQKTPKIQRKWECEELNNVQKCKKMQGMPRV